MVARHAHAQHPALHADRPHPPVTLNKGVLHFWPFAKYAVAFPRMSRSILTRANSARKRLISFCSALTALLLEATCSRPSRVAFVISVSLLYLITQQGIRFARARSHSIFQRNDAHWTLAEQLAGKQTPTQLGRALEELGIQQIPAYSPQARGRIERAWRAFQDRLVSELRLAQATTLPQANAVLARFCADYNQRFARPAAEAASDFRTLPRRFDLARCLSLHYQRIVAADHTVVLGAHSIALPPLPGHRGYAGETVELSHQLDGMLRVYRGDQLLLALPLSLEEHADRRPQPQIGR